MSIISCIVPVYNKESYIRKTVKSIIEQRTSDLDIILVNDGSTDGSGLICKELAEEYDFIKYICKDNEGPNSARKSGVDVAEGTYTTFIDADDIIQRGYLNDCIEIINRYKPDIIVNGYYDDHCHHIITNSVDDGLYDREWIEDCSVKNMICDAGLRRRIIPSICVKVIRTEIIERAIQDIDKNIVFGEDVLLSLSCMINADSIYINSKNCGYTYCDVRESLSLSYNPNWIENMSHYFDYLDILVADKHKTRFEKFILVYNGLLSELTKCYKEDVDIKLRLSSCFSYSDQLNKTLSDVRVLELKIPLFEKMRVFIFQHRLFGLLSLIHSMRRR